MNEPWPSHSITGPASSHCAMDELGPVTLTGLVSSHRAMNEPWPSHSITGPASSHCAMNEPGSSHTDWACLQSPRYERALAQSLYNWACLQSLRYGRAWSSHSDWACLQSLRYERALAQSLYNWACLQSLCYGRAWSSHSITGPASSHCAINEPGFSQSGFVSSHRAMDELGPVTLTGPASSHWAMNEPWPSHSDWVCLQSPRYERALAQSL